MAIYAIADLHLSLGTDKPMDVFRGWQDYTQRLKTNWENIVTENDTVVIPGDVSWAMRLENCIEDFSFIDKLPGKKIILKGNHDYWWSTMKKMQEFVKDNNFETISFIFNNSYVVENIAICGTRSWLFDIGEEQDAKIMNRELLRLTASLKSAGDNEKIVFLHYPPIGNNTRSQQVIDILQEYKVKKCYFGHLHSDSIRYAVQGEHDGIEYKLISSDSLNFLPYKIV